MPGEPWTGYFYVWLSGIALEKRLLTRSYFSSFSLLGMIRPYMVSYVNSRRGGSALSCNIDEQCLAAVITAVLSSVVGHVTPACASAPFKNKGLLCFLHLYFILVFDVKCMLSCPSLTVV